jgi:hypothetical protein
MKWVLGLLTVALIVLHQDFWNWDKVSAIGGFLPVGLWYHALFCIAASVLLGLFVRFAWPTHLESAEREVPVLPSTGSNHDH